MAISSDMKPIKITDSETGKQYILEFNRATVKATEQSGFNPELVDSQTVSQVSKLFYGAFKKNHPQISYDKVEKIIAERSKDTTIGFVANVKVKDDKKLKDLINQVETEDLIKFGLIPELVGRLPVVCTIDELSEDDLIRVLTEPKNAIVKQYKKLFQLEGVELEFEKDALREIAKKAIERKTGARGLRSIVENILGETMFEIPSDNNIEKVIITKECVVNQDKPKIIFKK